MQKPRGLRYSRLRLEALEERRLLSATPADDHADLVAEYAPQTSHVFDLDGYLSAPSTDAPLDVALDYISDNSAQWGISQTDVYSALVTDQYTDSDSGVTHIYLQQTLYGVEIVNAVMNINVTAEGQVINVGGGFVPSLDQLASGVIDVTAAAPDLSAVEALQSAAAQIGLDLDGVPSVLESAGGITRASTLLASAASLDEIPANLHYVATPDGLSLAWQLVLRTPDGEHWFDLSVDGTSGRLVRANDWVDHASYNVFPIPTEAPNDGGRAILVDPQDAVASPFGWHDTNGAAGAEFTDTRGNNVSAQEDANRNNTGGTRPSGGASLVFNFPFDDTKRPQQSLSAATTNLFYLNNILHDIHYQYGFTDAAGNFQVNNYGRGGTGNDAVQADSQDGSGKNNANFSTPPEGQSPRMQMFLWNQTRPGRDGAFDNGIIIHEYGHGVSNRLTGGPANSNALNAVQSGGMGEGWSDWWALMFLQRATDAKLGGYSIGTYVLGEPTSGDGIRQFPYSFDMSINPHTLDDYNDSQQVHDTGEIWATVLWDMSWLLIDKFGFSADLYNGAAGNNLALQLVTDGLKLQPANPSFLQARDAILMADTVLNGGANHGELWTAFARRGFGVSAVDGGSSSHTVTEAFDVPAPFQALAASYANVGGPASDAGTPNSLGGGDEANPLAAALVAAADAGGQPLVHVYDPSTLAERFSIMAYDAGFSGGVRVATGDLNGDGIADIITAAGPSGGPHIRAFDGQTGTQLAGPLGSFFAYDPGFTGGMFVAAGDVNGDGLADIITGADSGGGPHVRVFNGADGTVLNEFFAYDAGFRGGVRVAVGDVNDQASLEIITAAGEGGGPHVRVFSADGQSVAGSQSNLFAYDAAFTGGVYVATGDVDGDGLDDIVTGPGPGAGPNVRVFSGANGSPLASFMAFDASFQGGVRVSTGLFDNDDLSDIVAAAGPAGGPHVAVFSGIGGAPLGSFFAFDSTFAGGLFVASAYPVPQSQTVSSTGGTSLLASSVAFVATAEDDSTADDSCGEVLVPQDSTASTDTASTDDSSSSDEPLGSDGDTTLDPSSEEDDSSDGMNSNWLARLDTIFASDW